MKWVLMYSRTSTLQETDASGLSLFRSPSWRLFGSKTTLATTLEPSSIHCPDDDEFSLNINSDAVSTFDNIQVEQPIAGPSGLSVQQDEKTLDLTHQVERVGKYPVTSGGFADIWQGEWMKPPEYKIVSIIGLRFIHHWKMPFRLQLKLSDHSIPIASPRMLLRKYVQLFSWQFSIK